MLTSYEALTVKVKSYIWAGSLAAWLRYVGLPTLRGLRDDSLCLFLPTVYY